MAQISGTKQLDRLPVFCFAVAVPIARTVDGEIGNRFAANVGAVKFRPVKLFHVRIPSAVSVCEKVMATLLVSGVADGLFRVGESAVITGGAAAPPMA